MSIRRGKSEKKDQERHQDGPGGHVRPVDECPHVPAAEERPGNPPDDKMRDEEKKARHDGEPVYQAENHPSPPGTRRPSGSWAHATRTEGACTSLTEAGRGRRCWRPSGCATDGAPGAAARGSPESPRKPSPAPFFRTNSRLEMDTSACTCTGAVIDGSFSAMRHQPTWDGRPRPSCEGAGPGWPLVRVSRRTKGVSGSGQRGDGRGRPSHGDLPRPPGRDRRPACVRFFGRERRGRGR